jgi:hypothetical protein
MNAMKLSLQTIDANFSCDRTCPANKTHWCRFNAFFRLIGSARVHSHTVKVKVDYTDADTLHKACDTLGWKWLGQGKHELFDGAFTGHGFLPEGWSYPAVFANGELNADTYRDQWGEMSKLELLKAEYAIQTAMKAAEELGWQCERTEAGLTVYHPEAGVLTVSKEGICETTGFVGSSCHSAREALKLAADGNIQNKSEFSDVKLEVQAGS